ncbi:hypothetical protein [Denitrificimonas caeni]|uniref:hypothetical protein n=1 Tax=Denitrificimonas caeni TaxID=521720 RepID=UPI0019662288|nr:hypothetical protein [Denitrificimonas caeni]
MKEINKIKRKLEKFSYSSILDIVLNNLTNSRFISQNSIPHASQMSWINIAILSLAKNSFATKPIKAIDHFNICIDIFKLSDSLIPKNNENNLLWVRPLINQQALYSNYEQSQFIQRITRDYIIINNCKKIKIKLESELKYSIADSLIIKKIISIHLFTKKTICVGEIILDLNGRVSANSLINFFLNNTIKKENIKSFLEENEITTIDSAHRDSRLKEFIFYTSNYKVQPIEFNLSVQSIGQNIFMKMKRHCENLYEEYTNEFEKYILDLLRQSNLTVLSAEDLIVLYRKNCVPNSGRSNTDAVFVMDETLYLIEVKAIQETDFIKASTDQEIVTKQFDRSLTKSVHQIIKTASLIQEYNILAFKKAVGITVLADEFTLLSTATSITQAIGKEFNIPDNICKKLCIKDIHVMGANEFENFFHEKNTSSKNKIKELLEARKNNIHNGGEKPIITKDQSYQRKLLQAIKTNTVKKYDLLSTISSFNEKIFD